MDSTFWAGIAIGTIFSFVTNIIAQRTDFFFVKLLERLKLRSVERRTARENKQNKWAERLLSNPSLSSAYFSLRIASALFFSFAGIAGSALLAILWTSKETIHQVSELGIKPLDVRIALFSTEYMPQKIGIIIFYIAALFGGWTFLSAAGMFVRMSKLSRGIAIDNARSSKQP